MIRDDTHLGVIDHVPAAYSAPKRSRKTRRWSFVAVGRQWSAPDAALRELLKLLERRARTISTHDPRRRLLHEIHKQVWQIWVCSYESSRRVLPRGRNAVEGRNIFRDTVRMAAAWAYLFSLEEMRRPVKERSPAVQRLEQSLRNDFGYMSAARNEKAEELALLLVLCKFPRDAWRRFGLKVPRRESRETFVRHYLKEGGRLSAVRELARERPELISKRRSVFLHDLLEAATQGQAMEGRAGTI